MAISDYILGPRFINGGISTLNLPANVSPFFRMDATSGATPKPVDENFYEKFWKRIAVDIGCFINLFWNA